MTYNLLASFCILISASFLARTGAAFSVVRHDTSTSTTRSSLTNLGMAKSINKQADLMKKLKEAKQQAKESSGEVDDESEIPKKVSELSAQEVKERNDRLRFQQLLAEGGTSMLNDYSSDGYLNRQQEEEEISAARAGVSRMFEGDPAPAEPFEELVHIKTENGIGRQGAERLVPWLNKNAERQSDYLVVFCDPRMKSAELQQAVQNIVVDLPAPMLTRTIVINADTPAENRRWLKKSGLEGKIDVYSDEKMDWMRAYTALGDQRWSMTMYVIADERVQKLAREVDEYAASRAIRKAVDSLSTTRL